MKLRELKMGLKVVLLVVVIGLMSLTIHETRSEEQPDHVNHTASPMLVEANADASGIDTEEKLNTDSSLTGVTDEEDSDEREHIDPETAYEDSSSVTEVEESNSTTDSIQESHFSESIDETEGDNEQKIVELVSGTWGTVPWTWDENTKIIELESGVAGTVATAPWKTYSDDVVTVRLNGLVILPANSSQLFLGTGGRLPNLTTIENSHNFDTSRVTNMGAMFQSLRTLQFIDVSTWDTSNVTNMFGLFDGLSLVPELDVSNWVVSKVTDMSQMFSGVARVEKLDLSNWNTRNVQDMFVMLNRMSNLRELKLGPDSVFLSQTALPDIPIRDGYTGYWIRILDLEGNIPDETNRFTSRELTDNSSNPIPGTYIWERLESQPVTVRYVDTKNNDLWDKIILEGELGTSYETTAQEIPGWYVVQTPGNADGIFTEEAQEVVYVYDRSDAAPVTVRYEDSAGNQLSDPTLLSGKVGLPYESEAKEILGWYVVQTPGNADGIFTEEAQEVVYVYDRSDAAPVTVSYQNSAGNQLSDPTILSGKVGLPYESEAKEILGWYVVETPDNASGTFAEEAQEVVYVYERSDAAPVTVRYEDTEGNQLSDPTILSGKAGLTYESEAKEIPSWHVVETPENATGIFSEETQEVVYVYEREMNPEETEREETEVDLPDASQGKEELPLLGAKEGFSLLGIGLIGLAWLIHKLKFKKKSD